MGLPFMYVYIYDLLIMSTSVEGDFSHLREILARFQAHGLAMNVKKCTPGLCQISF